MSALSRLRTFWMPWATAIVLAFFSNAVAQSSYKVIDLGSLHGGNLGCAMAVNNHGWTEIMAGVLDPFTLSISQAPAKGRAVLGIDGLKIDLGTLGGPNSWMNWGGINDHGEVVGIAETSVPDPNGEDVCKFGTKLTCLPFLWQAGHMRALPTLGGNNGQASDINDHGQIVGTADTPATDSGCPPFHISSPVLWQAGKAQALPTVDDDPDGFVFAINAQGQAAGDSSNCSQTIIHAVSWENGMASPLPDFGNGSIAQAINDQGEIAGTVGSSDGSTQFAALWQNGTLTNLGTLPGDFAAFASGINNRGQIVGSTFDSKFTWLHGFIWQNNTMTDLNTLIPASAHLFVLMANKINEHGQISGMAMVTSGPHANKEIHAFLATPVEASVGLSVADVMGTHPKFNLPANLRTQLLPRLRAGGFGR